MSVPRISVVMPVLNPHPRYFPEAVASVLGQTFADWELVIVEDPGETSAADLLESFADERIRLTRNADRTSLVSQRNRTLELARGELVAFLDADDVMEPERLARQVAFLETHADVAVAGSQLTIIDANSKPTAVRDYPLEHATIARSMRRFNAIAQPSAAARRAALLSVGGYRSAFQACEDYDLWCRLLTRGDKFANLPERLLRYRLQPGQIKALRYRATIEETVAIKREHFGAVMTAGERLQCAAESCLKFVPPRLTMAIFARTRLKPLPRN